MIKKIISRVKNRLFLMTHKQTYNLKHGRRFYSNTLIDTLFPGLVQIGDDFTSAPGSIILSHDASIFKYTDSYRVEKTIIGDRVFLGANSIVMPGVCVGDDVIIGAGAVVTKNVPSGSVVVGNPARVIGNVDKYIEKCSERKVLYKPHQEVINAAKEGLMLDESLKYILRESIYNQFYNGL